ncbi:hypothetical protein [Microbacterium sp. NIBRBAC000506063]|uniref:hypothetical protein n=1 Tax=Microbacterium sp. NIBRBAC000506063 TaxID=2734618 RepID=UPI002948B8E8|nr:hypothetical protein [Microbacterium sp. NIBRBAC000506063]
MHPRLLDTDWLGAFTAIRSVTTRPSLVVVLTAQDSPETARSFLGSFPAATRATTFLVGSVTDDAIGRLARERGSREDIYLAAAAERTLREAETVADAIRRAGGEAISADPELLPRASPTAIWSSRRRVCCSRGATPRRSQLLRPALVASHH